jgi:S1-C subfamily serine protease
MESQQRTKSNVFLVLCMAVLQVSCSSLPPNAESFSGRPPENASHLNFSAGFFVDNGGDVVTSAALVRSCRAIYVSWADHNPVPAAVLAQQPDPLRIALLHSEIAGNEFVPLSTRISSSEKFSPSELERLRIIGVETTGIVQPKMTLKERPVRHMQTTTLTWPGFPSLLTMYAADASIDNGFGGGPVLDADGHALGVMAEGLSSEAVEKAAAFERVNLIATAAQVASLAREAHVTLPPPDNGVAKYSLDQAVTNVFCYR